MPIILLFVILTVLLACSNPSENVVEEVSETVADDSAVISNAEKVVEEVSETVADDSAVISASASVGPYGLQAMEEGILLNTNIVKARLSSVTSETIVGNNGKFFASTKFNLTVVEDLKGTSQTNIVAYRVYGIPIDTQDEADSWARRIFLNMRDTQWDNREAIIFLDRPPEHRSPKYMPQSLLSPADHYLLVWSSLASDDMYSLHSRFQRKWLPAASSTTTQSTGNDQEFLLALPTGIPGGTAHDTSLGRSVDASASSASNATTITLGDVKSRIAAVMAEYNGGDGSASYKECVMRKYRELRYFRAREAEGRQWTIWETTHTMESGLPAQTVVHEVVTVFDEDRGSLTQYTATGTHAGLFAAESGPSTRIDRDNDGTLDWYRFSEFLRTTRPLPAGLYEFGLEGSWHNNRICGYVVTTRFDVTVTAPDGVLHELFYDPVMVGTGVAADTTNGVLKPAAFTDANGASATIQRIEWQAGTVKLQVSPHNALEGQVVDIIELDGSVSLSLDVGDAVVDPSTGSGQAGTLSWSVSEQPWGDGDLLMLRVREGQ